MNSTPLNFRKEKEKMNRIFIKIMVVVSCMLVLVTAMVVPSFAAEVVTVLQPRYLITPRTEYANADLDQTIDFDYNGDFYLKVWFEDYTAAIYSSYDVVQDAHFSVLEGIDDYWYSFYLFWDTEECVILRINFYIETGALKSIELKESGETKTLSNFELYLSPDAEGVESVVGIYESMGCNVEYQEYIEPENPFDLPRYVFTSDGSNIMNGSDIAYIHFTGNTFWKVVDIYGNVCSFDSAERLSSGLWRDSVYENSFYLYTGAEDYVLNFNFDSEHNLTSMSTDISGNMVEISSFEIYFDANADGAKELADQLRRIGGNVILQDGDSPLDLVGMMFGNFGVSVAGLANGIKESVTNIIYDTAADGTRVLSDVVIFIFTIAGLAIAMTVFWLIFRLIRFGRQR